MKIIDSADFGMLMLIVGLGVGLYLGFFAGGYWVVEGKETFGLGAVTEIYKVMGWFS